MKAAPVDVNAGVRNVERQLSTAALLYETSASIRNMPKS